MIKLNVNKSGLGELLDLSIEVDTETSVTTIDSVSTTIEQGLIDPDDLYTVLDDLEHQIFVIRNEYL